MRSLTEHSLFTNKKTIEIIAKLERTVSTARQNKDQTQNPKTLGATVNNNSTTTE